MPNFLSPLLSSSGEITGKLFSFFFFFEHKRLSGELRPLLASMCLRSSTSKVGRYATDRRPLLKMSDPQVSNNCHGSMEKRRPFSRTVYTQRIKLGSDRKRRRRRLTAKSQKINWSIVDPSLFLLVSASLIVYFSSPPSFFSLCVLSTVVPHFPLLDHFVVTA